MYLHLESINITYLYIFIVICVIAIKIKFFKIFYHKLISSNNIKKINL